MRTQLRVSDLTVEQLQRLIKKTVQESVAEVMVEFLMTAELDADMTQEVELVEAAVGSRKTKRKRDSQSLKLDD